MVRWDTLPAVTAAVAADAPPLVPDEELAGSTRLTRAFLINKPWFGGHLKYWRAHCTVDEFGWGGGGRRLE